MDPREVAHDLLAAFGVGDLARMREFMAPECVAWVTTADGTPTQVVGRDAYLDRIAAMDLPGTHYSVTSTQPPVLVDAELILLMVEVRAARGERTLHNFASHLLRVRDGAVQEWWMTDAKPVESEQFWA